VRAEARLASSPRVVKMTRMFVNMALGYRQGARRHTHGTQDEFLQNSREVTLDFRVTSTRFLPPRFAR